MADELQPEQVEEPASANKARPAMAGLARPRGIVGIGASAGGLEALESFFDALPPDTGLAFVVVQHLSPDFKSLMQELLSRHTSMAVHRVQEGLEIEPNSVYLIPAKAEMIVAGGRLHLTERDASEGLAMPIDVFLRSLAQDAGRQAVAVILSGTGSDGSRGLLAIHEEGGLVIAQSKESARFDGMPRCAVETGVVDAVLAPDEMPRAILEHFSKHGPPLVLPPEPMPAGSDGNSEIVFRLLQDEFGIDFRHYRPSTVSRRLERRLGLNRTDDLTGYVRRLRDDPAELQALYRDLLIGVTKFFRDQEAFQRLEREVIPPLLSSAATRGEFRVWIAGCATGEEAYSVAMLIHEHLAAAGRTLDVKVFATDVHPASLDFASAGVYTEASLAEVNRARLDRYFAPYGRAYRVSPDLRRMIVFARHNVIDDAPFTRLDLVLCRNLLIYFEPFVQRKVLSMFHFGLRTEGVLFLGPSESPGDLLDDFAAVDSYWKIFRKRRDSRLPVEVPLRPSPGAALPRPSGLLRPHQIAGYPDARLMRAYDKLLEEHVPPSLLVNERRELVHTFGKAGQYLRPRDGRYSFDILDMVDGDLRLALTGAMLRAGKQADPVAFSGLVVRTPDGPAQIKLSVTPIATQDSEPPFMLISFESPAAEKRPPAVAAIDLGEASREQLAALEAELRQTKENLQATIEELETSNEELQAANEELQAANEELQSTNEELHSVNEELYTVNAEYQRKIEELTELNADMDNLFCSIDEGTIFLNHELRIRRFSPRIANLFHILPQDIGRPLDSFSHNLAVDDLLGILARVLHAGVPLEREVRDRDDHWYLMRVLPYRAKSKIEGVVLSLIDISALKATQERLLAISSEGGGGPAP
jgi:two-component system, chemotaxis family, CheB/CheR fusion protein